MEWIKIIISATALIFIAVIVYKSVFAGIFHRREPNMYVIVGLGNPGREYADTKHNVGFMVIDKLADQYNIDVTKFKHKAFVGDGIISGKKVMLVKPQTYMNRSGESVKEIMSFYKVPTENMIVIYDDTILEKMCIRDRAKLLRVLQEKEIEKIGGYKSIPVDIRIVAATRKNLEEMIENGQFREDLYYRLNVINIEMPPLRKRIGDIPVLARYFLNRLNNEYKTNIITVSYTHLEVYKRQGYT